MATTNGPTAGPTAIPAVNCADKAALQPRETGGKCILGLSISLEYMVLPIPGIDGAVQPLNSLLFHVLPDCYSVILLKKINHNVR
jgi:hypothetical protein